MINDGNINQKQPLEYQLCPREEISFPFNRFLSLNRKDFINGRLFVKFEGPRN